MRCISFLLFFVRSFVCLCGYFWVVVFVSVCIYIFLWFQFHIPFTSHIGVLSSSLSSVLAVLEHEARYLMSHIMLQFQFNAHLCIVSHVS